MTLTQNCGCLPDICDECGGKFHLDGYCPRVGRLRDNPIHALAPPSPLETFDLARCEECGNGDIAWPRGEPHPICTDCVFAALAAAQQEVARLREALEEIRGEWPTAESIAEGGVGCGCGHEEIARAALASGEKP